MEKVGARTEESEERRAEKKEESHSKEEKRSKIADKQSSEAEDEEKTKAEEISFLLTKWLLPLETILWWMCRRILTLV